MLSGKNLLNAARVNRMWFSICKSDHQLRRKIRRHLRQKKRAEIATRLSGTGRTNRHVNIADRQAFMNENTIRSTGVRDHSKST